MAETDRLRRFLFESAPVRGHWVRLSRAWIEAREHQVLTPAAQSLLGESLAAAALFLAGVDWYGHRRDLLEIASILSPGSPGNLGNLVARTGFDLSRFSNHLRRLLDDAVAPS